MDQVSLLVLGGFRSPVLFQQCDTACASLYTRLGAQALAYFMVHQNLHTTIPKRKFLTLISGPNVSVGEYILPPRTTLISAGDF